MAIRLRQITKIQAEDPVLNRVQDQLMAALNPVLRALPPGLDNKPTITGSAGGNAALTSLLSALEAMGLIVDNST